MVWDLHEGSYDTELQRVRAEKAGNDPPPLTAQRLRTLLAALAGNDPHDHRWANDELADALPDDSWQDEASPEEMWTDEIIDALEVASREALTALSH